MTERERMKQALLTHFLPVLHEMGFDGEWPNYRRIAQDKVDLLSIVFDKWGGAFAMEISYAYLGVQAGNLLPGQGGVSPEQLTVFKTYKRKRLPQAGGWIYFCDLVRIKSPDGDTLYSLTEKQKQAFLQKIPSEDFLIEEEVGEGIYCRSAVTAVKLLKSAEKWWGQHVPQPAPQPEHDSVQVAEPEPKTGEPEKRRSLFRLIQGGKKKNKNM